MCCCCYYSPPTPTLSHSLRLSHTGTCDPNEYVQLAKREECEEACRSDNEDKVDAEMKTVLVFGNDMAAENVAYLMLLFEAVSAIGLIVFTVWLTAKVTEEAQRYVPALTFFSFRLANLTNLPQTRSDDNTASPADYTVFVRNLPPSATEAEIRSFFSERYDL